MNRKVSGEQDNVEAAVPDVPVPTFAPSQQPQEQQQQQQRPPPNNQLLNLLNANVTTPNTAFNVIIGFVGLAQGRGAYSLEEAAKIFECIKMFRIENQPTPSQ